MVRDNEINICRVCGDEIVGREEVELIVSGEQTLYVPRDKMRWNSYTSGHSFVYVTFGGQTGSRGATKNIVCGCNVEKDCDPVLMMVRKEFRDQVVSRFGARITVPLLFKLPPAMVAWENSAFVCAEPTVDGLMLSNQGMQLIDVIADMSRVGIFEGTKPMFTEHDIATGFSYLHVIKPIYRAFVAMDFGVAASVAAVVARVPQDWVDWQEMVSLRADVESEDVIVKRVVGAPLVDRVVDLLATPVRAVAAQPVVAGVAVTRNNTCVQMLPNSLEDDWDYNQEIRSTVLLDEGQSFIPAGHVMLSGQSLAVTFDPGTVLVTEAGTEIRAVDGSVTLFLNGSVSLCIRDRGGLSVGWTDQTNVQYKQYAVAVVCDSYAQGMSLYGWYKRKFDVCSTEARFYTAHAEVLLLSSYLSCDAGNHVTCKVDDAHCRDKGSFSLQYSGDLPNVDAVGKLRGGAMVVSGSEVSFGVRRMVLGGAVVLNEKSCVGVLGDVQFSFDKYLDVQSALWGIPDVESFEFLVTKIFDEYIIDGGGPSGSDGMFFDDTGTFRSSKALSVLTWFKHHGEFVDRTYLLIAKHGPTMAHELGVSPTLRQLVECPAYLIDEEALSRTGVVRSDGDWCVAVGGTYQFTWAGIHSLVRAWSCIQYDSKSFGFLLASKYGRVGDLSIMEDDQFG